MEKKENKFRSRTIALLLYPSDETHVQALEKIKANYDYIGCLHDKDFDENGEIKKPHYHIIVRCKNAVWNTALCKELGITPNYSEQIRNLDNTILYLIHYNDNDKYQYDINEVFGTFKNRIKDIINSQTKSESEKICELIDYIENQNCYITTTSFSKYCALNGYWSEFRRSGSIFLKMIDEHNHRFTVEKMSDN